MQFTTKGRIAVRAMVDLAAPDNKAPVNLQGISERQNISLSYLEALFSKLLRHNIVRSVRGPGGGYHLARPAAQITVAQIVMAADGAVGGIEAKGKRSSQSALPSSTDDLWQQVLAMALDYLSTISLQQLVDQQLQDKVGALPGNQINRRL